MVELQAHFQLTTSSSLENKKRSKDEMYRHLSVDVGEDSELDTWTVERSLQQFFQPERRELKCERCESGETATQTLEIISWSVRFYIIKSTFHIMFDLLQLIVFANHCYLRSPKVLLLHFKRFIVTQEMKVGRSEGDRNENKQAVPPRMEMVLRKNEVRHSVKPFHTPHIFFRASSAHSLIESTHPISRPKYLLKSLFQSIHSWAK